MKKALIFVMMVSLLLLTVAGCKSGNSSEGKNNQITVVSREDGSGTRGAFIQLFELEEKDDNGNKIDTTYERAEITNNTSVILTSVAGDKSAIGYISLGSLNDSVKALSIDGVAPSVESIKDGSYTSSRPFNIATKGELSPTSQDFISFIVSTQGQKVVESKGYIPMDITASYHGTKAAGKVVVAGSSSVSPVMEALKESYEAINPAAKIEIQQSDSTTGMNSAIEGICDIGMASRSLKDSELEKGLVSTVIALDGIVVVVNNENPLNNLSKEQVKQVFTRSVKDWSELS
ncbi:MAG: phosphate transporter substrate-binding protein [Evtepia sp.]|jgi:phosphate transport system substrate-binding protein|nr:phosphate transporter substrate-binding protein [Evtepia sp.]